MLPPVHLPEWACLSALYTWPGPENPAFLYASKTLGIYSGINSGKYIPAWFPIPDPHLVFLLEVICLILSGIKANPISGFLFPSSERIAVPDLGFYFLFFFFFSEFFSDLFPGFLFLTIFFELLFWFLNFRSIFHCRYSFSFLAISFWMPRLFKSISIAAL